MALKRNWCILLVFFTAYEFCLQVEPCDDYEGNIASDVSNKSHDVIGDSDLPTVKQVNILWSDGC